MREMDIHESTITLFLCLVATACAASSQSSGGAATPQPVNQSVQASPTKAGEPSPAGGDQEDTAEIASPGDDMVGMKFEDARGDEEATDRTPPPTRSWKPLEKEKQAKTAREPANDK